MSAINIDKVNVRKTDYPPDAPWQVWIPPTAPEHYEGDAIVAPYGDSMWTTWDEACEFVGSVIHNV